MAVLKRHLVDKVPGCNLCDELGLNPTVFYDWRNRYGKLNEQNAQVPCHHWLTEDEKRAIRDYGRQYPLEGCRRLAFMMRDDGVAAAIAP